MHKFSLRCLIVGIGLICCISLDALSQCGVYLKRTSSQTFPFTGVSLDKAEDMTGDGLPDLVASGVALTVARTRLFVIPNNGNGTFGTPIVIEAPAGQSFDQDYYVGKVNSDAFKDIIVETNGATGLQVYLNNGNGTFTAQAPFSISGRGIVGPGFADVNGDGLDDYLGFGNGVTYSENNGDGTFDPPAVIVPQVGALHGDFNGDGKLDFINQVSLYLNQGNGTFAVSDATQYLPFGSVVYDTQDFNGDGKEDVLTTSSSGEGFAILTSTGTGFTRTNYNMNDSSSWNGFPMAVKLGGNAAVDVVYSSVRLNRKAVYINDGTGNFTSQISGQKFEGTADSPRVIADFDNDGKADIVQVASSLPNSSPFFADISSFNFLKNVCDIPGQPHIVDFDRSGTTDWAVFENGQWRWTTGSGSTLRTELFPWGSPGDTPVPGDYDGDGVTDYAVFRGSTGEWHIRRSSDQVWLPIAFGLTGDKPVSADYDGDGVSDLAVWRPSTGVWHIWSMRLGQYTAVQFGLGGDKPAPADFDGDLKTDIVVYRPSTGVWYYLRSTNGSVGIELWGTSEDKPIPVDFDGDMRADLAVYRPSNNTAYVRRSFDGLIAGFTWGVAGDVLQVADWNGDFRADLGIYRPSNGQWWNTTNRFAPSRLFGSQGNVEPVSSILRVE